MVNGVSIVRICMDEWCFNGGVCMVNGVSMVELYSQWYCKW